MHTVRDEQPHLEILEKGGTSTGCISRGSKTQTTGLIRNEATPPGSHCGGRWPGRKLKTSSAKAPAWAFVDPLL